MKTRLTDVARFDSDEVDSALRHDAWKENMGVLFDIAPKDERPHKVSQRSIIEAADLGGMVLARAKAEGQRFFREIQRVRREGMGLILVQYFISGGGNIKGGERLRPGDMQIVDTEQPYELLATDYENLTLMAPYDLRHCISPVIETLHGRPIDGRNPLVRLLGGHLQNLWHNVPHMTTSQASTALEGTLGLMKGWLGADSRLPEALEPSVAVSLAETVCRYIDHHLAEPLHPAELARHSRVSRTQIYLLFQPHNGVARYVLKRRLDRAFRMLTSPHLRHRSV